LWASVFLVAGLADDPCSDPSNVVFRDDATAAAISCWTAKMSLSSRSNVRVQSSIPSAALINSATIRTRSPCLRTVPSSNVATPNFSPIVLLSSFLSLKRNEELRPITFNSLICARAAINSSESPSEKYSSFGSPLSFNNGRTAIDLLLTLAADVDLDPRNNWKTRRAAAMTARPMMNPANFFLLQYSMDRTSSAEMSDVRFIPSGVISNAHEIMTARMKPSERKTVNAFITQFD